jgi:hypothetical protein
MYKMAVNKRGFMLTILFWLLVITIAVSVWTLVDKYRQRSGQDFRHPADVATHPTILTPHKQILSALYQRNR